MTGGTISAGYPRALLDFAVSKGAGRADMLARTGLSEDDLRHQDNRIPLSQYLALFDAAIAATGEPGLALKFGQAVRMQEVSIVGLICEACTYTHEVGPALNRYARLVVDVEAGLEPSLINAKITPEGLWIGQPNHVFARTPHLAEAEIARLVWNTKIMFAASPEFQAMVYPRAVSFIHPEPNYRSEYEAVLQCPVTFGAERTAVLTDPGFMMLKQPPVNRYVFGVLSERAEALLKELEASKTVRGQVETELMQILHTGEIGMDAVAAKIGLTRPTLARRLKAEGATFEQVLDELRRRLALDFLHGRKVSVNETAYLVGFSEPAAFSRAFKRWTGISPREAREQG